MLNRILGFVIMIIALFGVLFDPDGAQYGLLAIVPPEGAIVIADFVGNLLWVLGVFYFIVGLILIAMAFSDDLMTKTMDSMRKSNHSEWKHFGKRHLVATLTSIIAAFGAVLALGSGFWFFGSMWIFGLLAAHSMKKEAKVARAKYDAIQLLTEDA